MSYADLQTELTAIKTAITAGQYDSAEVLIANAWATLAGLPTRTASQQKETELGTRALEKLEASVEKLRKRSGAGFMRIPEIRKRTGEAWDADGNAQ